MEPDFYEGSAVYPDKLSDLINFLHKGLADVEGDSNFFCRLIDRDIRKVNKIMNIFSLIKPSIKFFIAFRELFLSHKVVPPVFVTA